MVTPRKAGVCPRVRAEVSVTFLKVPDTFYRLPPRATPHQLHARHHKHGANCISQIPCRQALCGETPH